MTLREGEASLKGEGEGGVFEGERGFKVEGGRGGLRRGREGIEGGGASEGGLRNGTCSTKPTLRPSICAPSPPPAVTAPPPLLPSTVKPLPFNLEAWTPGFVHSLSARNIASVHGR